MENTTALSLAVQNAFPDRFGTSMSHIEQRKSFSRAFVENEAETKAPALAHAKMPNNENALHWSEASSRAKQSLLTSVSWERVLKVEADAHGELIQASQIRGRLRPE
jgi:hypothetical protein